MKKLGLLAFALLALAVMFSGRTASALEEIVAYKEATLTIQVIAASPVAYLRAPATDGRLQVAGISSYDVPMGILPPTTIAQSQAQGNIPVKFTTKPDPTATYLHIVPIATSLTAAAGQTTTFACAYEVYAYYTTAYSVTDWSYGTASSGSGYFPLFNNPQTSDLSWQLTTTTPGEYTAFANAGTPGQTSFTGTAGQHQTPCVNLSLTVPLATAPGYYTAVVQYNLYSL